MQSMPVGSLDLLKAIANMGRELPREIVDQIRDKIRGYERQANRMSLDFCKVAIAAVATIGAAVTIDSYLKSYAMLMGIGVWIACLLVTVIGFVALRYRAERQAKYWKTCLARAAHNSCICALHLQKQNYARCPQNLPLRHAKYVCVFNQA